MRNAWRALSIAAVILCGCSDESGPPPCDPKVENGARMSSRGATPVVCVAQPLELAFDLWECSTNAEVTPFATWTSDKPSIATVEKGVVTGVAPGKATITAEYAGRSASIAVDVVACP